MTRSILSPEERAEYDALLRDAAYDNGRLVRTAQYADRANRLLIDAVKAGRRWAEFELERALHDGLRSEVRRYVRRINQTTVTDLTGTKSRPSVYSVREDQPTGGVAWQPKLLSEFSLADLDALITASEAQLSAYVANRNAARHLRDKLISTGASTVRDALAALGMSLEQALAA